MKLNEKQKGTIKIVVTCIVVLLIVWFIILSPYLKFKNNEKIMKKAITRYYEINTLQVPTGNKVKSVSLQTLYDKGFIENDLRSPYSNKSCDSKVSWVKTKKENGVNKHYIYLKCGVFSSNVDHEGPNIKLKGEDQITINKGDEFKDPGIESVIDKVDGKINVNKVEIENKKVNTNKMGTYKITYKIKDSFNNETLKIRTINVIETLNHIVKKDNNNAKVYKGHQTNNYVKIDGIIFKIINENEDGTIKVVADDNLAAINYSGTDKWLNEYFYEKLSDSAKKLIVKSKWCNEKITDANNYTKCNKYSKKRYVGLLSVMDINNSKGENGIYNVRNSNNTILGNLKNSKKVLTFKDNKYEDYNIDENIGIRPVINIKKNANIVSGDGSTINPYILKENNKKLKVGTLISEASTGEYISYSGYQWRVIGKEEDGTTKVIMSELLEGNTLPFDENGQVSMYNINQKSNIGYKINNNYTEYINLKYFAKKEINIKNYDKKVAYDSKYSVKKIKTKVILPSIYDLYSGVYAHDFWYIDYSKNQNQNYQYLEVQGVVRGNDTVTEAGIKLIGYLDSKLKVKSGSGTRNDGYVITK